MGRKHQMQIKIQIIIEHEDKSTTAHDISSFDREELSVATLGLTLAEHKTITTKMQQTMIDAQVKDYLAQQRSCSRCEKLKSIKGYHPIIFRTLFGKIILKSPQLVECSCEQQTKQRFSPLAKMLTERTAPELLYLESKWGSLMSYGVAANVLEEILPIRISPSTICKTVSKTATRLEQELPEEKEAYAAGCQSTWDSLPRPDLPLTVAIDGCFVHAREEKDRKAGWFEITIGKSLQEGQDPKRFGYVTTLDEKPKRRLYAMLKEQGLQMNQEIIFITDGGDNVRSLPQYLSPRSEHILDWFHIAMKVTVIKQIAKGNLPDEEQEPFQEKMESIKWHIWHGNSFRALELLDELNDELYSFPEESKDAKKHKQSKLWQMVDEFNTYIENNKTFIINYGEKYRHGETISSSFAESTVDELVSRRMVKKQHMRWTKKGAHMLLQVRVKALNNDLRKSFVKWYPKMNQEKEGLPLAA